MGYRSNSIAILCNVGPLSFLPASCLSILMSSFRLSVLPPVCLCICSICLPSLFLSMPCRPSFLSCAPHTVHLYAILSSCLSVWQSAGGWVGLSLSVSLLICPFVRPSVRSFVCKTIDSSVHLSFVPAVRSDGCLSICVHQSIHPFFGQMLFCLSVHPSVLRLPVFQFLSLSRLPSRLSVCAPVHLSIFLLFWSISQAPGLSGCQSVSQCLFVFPSGYSRCVSHTHLLVDEA